jgi:hypothetical protein
LRAGKTARSARPDQSSAGSHAFDDACTDQPGGPQGSAVAPVVIDGVRIQLLRATPAGESGRKWSGRRCAFELSLGDGTGRPVELADQVPPFNALTSLVRAGSTAWVELSFNGYTREFPQGGQRVVAVDLCEGRVRWTSKDGVSNGGLLLLGDYLVTAFGFTGEPRFVNVLDAWSGASVQKLPVVENLCPSKAWAPQWNGGRCDAPGQRVGAATRPRIEDGLFLVDTNTGSAAFELESP